MNKTDRIERLDQIQNKMNEILEKQSEILERQKALDSASAEYNELNKQYYALSQEWNVIFDENNMLMDEELTELQTILDDIEATHKKLEESGFLEKLNKSSNVLENPDAYTEAEVKEAEEFENKLNELFLKYTEENPDGPTQDIDSDCTPA